MIYTAQNREFAPYVERRVPARCGVGATLSGFLRRLIGAIYDSRQRQTDREVARILARSGGRITDASEREMTRRLMGQ
jgi:hypothetical protein